jgi:hypothetical protein
LIADLSRENIDCIYLIDLNIVVSSCRKLLLHLLLCVFVYPNVEHLFRLIAILEHPRPSRRIIGSTTIRGRIRGLGPYWRDRSL